MLLFKDTNAKELFWSQETDPNALDAFLSQVNSKLENPEPEAPPAPPAPVAPAANPQME